MQVKKKELQLLFTLKIRMGENVISESMALLLVQESMDAISQKFRLEVL